MKSSIAKAILVGAAGSLTTNILHEVVRRGTTEPPRVDLLGMQALAKSTEALGQDPPRGRALYGATLLGDLASNGAYFALVARGPSARGAKIGLGIFLGIAAGLGAVALPKRLGLTSQTTSRTAKTAALTISIYTVGGVVAGLMATVL